MWRLALLVVALVGAASGDENSHKVFRIKPESKEQLSFLRSLENDEENGWSFWKDPTSVSQSADLMVSPEKLGNFSFLMSARGIAYETLIDNVEQQLAAESNITRTRSRLSSFGWTRYHNLEEIYSWLDSLASEFPSIVEPIVGGRTHEGRKIRGIKISFGASRPGVFIEGGIHAREWISQATVTYLVDQLLRSEDSQVRALAEAHDWYVIPVFNPDGYAYTHLNPRSIQNRLWRKTRTPGNGWFSCDGTDMNRNWGFQWMTIGASSNPCSEAYAGSGPFSTVEAKTLSQYISSLRGKLFAYVAFHSYSQFLMFPYGHTRSHLDNYDEELAIARKSVAALSRRYGTRYRAGSIGEVIGLASGGSVDWVKASLKLPLVYIYELRDTGNSGFLLPPQQIIPTGQEVLDSLVALFHEAKKFGYPSR